MRTLSPYVHPLPSSLINLFIYGYFGRGSRYHNHIVLYPSIVNIKRYFLLRTAFEYKTFYILRGGAATPYTYLPPTHPVYVTARMKYNAIRRTDFKI